MSSKEGYLDLLGNNLKVGDNVFILRASLPANVKPDPSKVDDVLLGKIIGFSARKAACVQVSLAGRITIHKFPHNTVKIDISLPKEALRLHAKILFPNATDINI